MTLTREDIQSVERKILFRGKRKDNGEWVCGYYGFLHDGDRHVIMCETVSIQRRSYFTDYEVDPVTVGQNTGLKDKNGRGREIYEGDIYQCEGRLYVVEWSEYSLSWVVRSLKSKQVLPGYLQGEVSIYDDYIYKGTRFENAELLDL